jgi:outer membrane receptor protein involved in Fe transport
MDYVHPFLNSKGKWEAGAKATMRVLNNKFKVEEQGDDEQWNLLQDYDNHLVYTENIYAAYIMAGNEWNRFSFQGGLRGELSDISVELKKTNQTNYQNYFNIFPSAHLSYKLSEQKTVQLSYSYRLSRPRFRELIPFSGFSNNRSIWGGNPNLRPEYTHSIETGYLLNWQSGSILTSAYYRYRTGVIQRIPLTDPNTGFVRPFPINLATEDAYGFEFNFSWNPVKWWRVNSSANFYRAITEGRYEEVDYFSDTYTWNTRSTSRITFLKKFDFQAGINYRAPRITPTGSQKAMYSIDLGLSREVFKGNGTLTFSVRDLLNSRKFRGTTQTAEYYSESVFQWRARQMTLTFTYRLNQKKDRQRGRDGEERDGEWGGDNNEFGGDFNNN